MLPLSKGYIFAGLAIIGFISGWQIRSWYQSSVDLARLKATEKSIEEFKVIESSISKTLESKLQDIQDNAKTIYKYTEKIIERPVYSNECIDDAGLQYVNSLFQDNTTEPSNEMPSFFKSNDRFEWKSED